MIQTTFNIFFIILFSIFFIKDLDSKDVTSMIIHLTLLFLNIFFALRNLELLFLGV